MTNHPEALTQSITVYTKPNCPQCEATKRSLNRAGLAYNTIDITTDEHALNLLQQAGFKQAPVVMINREGSDPTLLDYWSGYRPDKLRELIHQ